MTPRALVALGAMLLASCQPAQRAGPITVSIIQARQAPNGSLLELAVRQASGRGLVRLDASGQVIPDLAARWAIGDDGLDYIFRLDDGVAPRATVRRLRALLAAPRNPLRTWLAPVERIEAVTATVIEIHLASPMPDLLSLLARPEMTLAEMPGPMRLASSEVGAARLAARDAAGGGLTLLGEHAGRAIARFAAGKADAVLGGTFADLAVAQAAALPTGTFVRDPAEGLFGFAARAIKGPAGDAAIMRALDQAIDRDRIVALVGGAGARKATTIAGSTIEAPFAERIAAARRAIPAPLDLRVAMPDGPGARLLFKLVAQDWARIGVRAMAVAVDAPADLLLIDSIVPEGEVARIACAVSAGCDQRDPLALLDPRFIPLMQPVRWSLVARSIAAFSENPVAAHPVDQLRRVR